MIDQDAVRFRWVFKNRYIQMQAGWYLACTNLQKWENIHDWRDAVDRLMEQERELSQA